jgi:hypothetical protein
MCGVRNLVLRAPYFFVFLRVRQFFSLISIVWPFLPFYAIDNHALLPKPILLTEHKANEKAFFKFKKSF